MGQTYIKMVNTGSGYAIKAWKKDGYLLQALYPVGKSWF
jgi:hypothetical protein